MKDLLKKKTDLPCDNYLSDLNIGFKYYNLKGGNSFVKQKTNMNYLFFLTDGQVVVRYDEYNKILIESREFFLIPKKSELSIKILVSGDMIVFSFDSLKNICDKIALKSYSAITDQIEFVFQAFPVRYALNDFLYLLLRYLRNGLDCSHMVDIKQQELFILLRKFYDKEEMATLFHPILGKSLDFKDQVIQYYQEATGVDDLAKKMGMGRTNFDMKFKNEFGIPPLQWMLKQKAKHVRFSMSEPGSTLSDIMRKYNFNSPTHLNRFCKQQFGCSPSELMKKMNPKE